MNEDGEVYDELKQIPALVLPFYFLCRNPPHCRVQPCMPAVDEGLAQANGVR